MQILQRKYIVELAGHDVDAILYCVKEAMSRKLSEDDAASNEFLLGLDVDTLEAIIDKLGVL